MSTPSPAGSAGRACTTNHLPDGDLMGPSRRAIRATRGKGAMLPLTDGHRDGQRPASLSLKRCALPASEPSPATLLSTTPAAWASTAGSPPANRWFLAGVGRPCCACLPWRPALGDPAGFAACRRVREARGFYDLGPCYGFRSLESRGHRGPGYGVCAVRGGRPAGHRRG